jgi:hypothetical protein
MESIVEVGSWKGRSTHALLTGCKGFVFSVDHFGGSPNELNGTHLEATQTDIYLDFKKNVGYFPNLIVMRMDSQKAATFFRSKSIDMIFIDATHTYAALKQDIISWIPICRKLICGHDAQSCGFDEAILETLGGYTVELASIWLKDLCQ